MLPRQSHSTAVIYAPLRMAYVVVGLCCGGLASGQQAPLIDSLRDAQGRVQAYSDGYRVYGKEHRPYEGEQGELNPGLRPVTVPVARALSRWLLLQVDGAGRVVSARVVEGATGQVLRSPVRLEDFELIETEKGRLLGVAEGGRTRVYDLARPLMRPQAMGARAMSRLRAQASSWRAQAQEQAKAQLAQLRQGLLLRMPPLPNIPSLRQLPSVPSALPDVPAKLSGVSLSASAATQQIGESSATPTVGNSLPTSSPTSSPTTSSTPSLPALGPQSASQRTLRLLGADQRRVGTWYFGYGAGLRFGAAGVEAIAGGQLQQLEGSAALADSTGALLAYTDGVTVYDAKHRVVTGGQGLSADASSTQGALLVPVPGRGDQVLLFTVDQGGYRGASRGLRASRLDLSGGLDRAKLTAPDRDVLLESQATEKLAAVHHANGQDVWVVGHRLYSREFVAYRVTAEGIVGAPVVSAVGLMHSGLGNGSIGQLKFSADGRKLAVAVTGADAVEVFAFDAASGQVGRLLAGVFAQDGGAVQEPYGVEFSPSGRYVYVTSWRRHWVGRMDLEQVDSSGRAPLQWQAGAWAGVTTGALQLGPDGNIYVALCNGPAGQGHDYLGRIEQPEGAWRYRADAVRLAEGTRSSYGLPTLLASNVVRPGVRFEVSGGCVGGPTAFRNTTPTRADVKRWRWDMGDGSVSSEQAPTHVFATAGDYRVRLIGERGDGSRDTAWGRVQVRMAPSVALGPDTLLPADGRALRIGPHTVDSTSLYRWSTGAVTPQLEVHSPGAYVLTVSAGDCRAVDTLRVFPRPSVITASGASGASSTIEPTAEQAAAESSSLLNLSALQRALSPFEPVLSVTVGLGPADMPMTTGPLRVTPLGERSLLPTALFSQAFEMRPMLVAGLRYRFRQSR